MEYTAIQTIMAKTIKTRDSQSVFIDIVVVRVDENDAGSKRVDREATLSVAVDGTSVIILTNEPLCEP